jgi:hypothetical protein
MKAGPSDREITLSQRIGAVPSGLGYPIVAEGVSGL